MKTIALLISLFIISLTTLTAQEKPVNLIGIHTSLSAGALIHYAGRLDGDASFKGRAGILFGIGYTRILTERIEFETGCDFSRNRFSVSYIDATGNRVESEYPENLDLLTVPLNIRYRLKKRFSLTGGIQYDQRINVMDCGNIDNQTGLGINLKFGKDIMITNNMILSVEPVFIVHAILPFYRINAQHRLTEFGLRIGYHYRF